MKKILKWTTILGVIFCLAGVGVITAGAMMGGAEQVMKIVNRELGMMDSQIDSMQVVEEQVVEAQTVLDSNQPDGSTQPVHTSNADVKWYSQVRKLDLEVGPGLVEIITEPRNDPQDTSIRVEMVLSGHNQNHQSYVVTMDGDELEIKRSGHHWKHDSFAGDFTMDELYIYVPEYYTLESIDAEVVAGNLSSYGVGVNELDLNLVSGVIEWTLPGEKIDYNYEIECKAGQVVLGAGTADEEIFSGLNQEREIHNRAAKNVDVGCIAGSVVITYTEK